jgi:hypothetical protein
MIDNPAFIDKLLVEAAERQQLTEGALPFNLRRTIQVTKDSSRSRPICSASDWSEIHTKVKGQQKRQPSSVSTAAIQITN